MGGTFNGMCKKHHIKHDFTSADWPQLNDVAKRGLTLVGKVTNAYSF